MGSAVGLVAGEAIPSTTAAYDLAGDQSPVGLTPVDRGFDSHDSLTYGPRPLINLDLGLS